MSVMKSGFVPAMVLPLSLAGGLWGCSSSPGGGISVGSAGSQYDMSAAPAVASMGSSRAAMAPMPQPVGDRFPEVSANPVKLVTEEPVSTFAADVDTASYAVVRRYLRQGKLPPAEAVRVEEMVNYFPYELPAAQDRDQPFSARVGIMPAPWNAEAKLMTISIKAMSLEAGARPPLNLVLVIDVSGSMDGADRLALVKSSLRDFARELRPSDKVGIVVYAGAAEVKLEPTSDKDEIIDTIDGLSAGGSTAGGAGLKEAYDLVRRHYAEGAVNRVILATDGDFNVGNTNPATLADFVEEQKKKGIYLSILGVGAGNLNDGLMQAIAQKGNGNAYYVDTALEGRKVLREEAASTLVPVADDVKFQVEFNPARVSEYRLIGYETRALAREDFNDDRVDAGDVGSGAAVTAIYEITPAGGKGYIDPLRYGFAGPPAGAHGDEFALLRIRYKLPGQGASRLIERPVTRRDEVTSLAQAGDNQRFQAAVAAYGQKLAGSRYVAGLSWEAIADLADGARGRDPDGYRAEFIQLVRTADGLAR